MSVARRVAAVGSVRSPIGLRTPAFRASQSSRAARSGLSGKRLVRHWCRRTTPSVRKTQSRALAPARTRTGSCGSRRAFRAYTREIRWARGRGSGSILRRCSAEVAVSEAVAVAFEALDLTCLGVGAVPRGPSASPIDDESAPWAPKRRGAPGSLSVHRAERARRPPAYAPRSMKKARATKNHSRPVHVVPSSQSQNAA